MMRLSRSWIVWLVVVVIVGCRGKQQTRSSHLEQGGEPAAQTAPTSVPPPDSRTVGAEKGPRTLLQRKGSAYAAQVFVHGDEQLIVTPGELVRVRDGLPVERHAVNLGHVVTLRGDSLVYVRDETLRELSLDTLKEGELLRLKTMPQFLLAEGASLAWVGREPAGTHSIQTISAGAMKLLYRSAQSIVSPVLWGEHVYFVVIVADGWRFGRAPLDGSAPLFSDVHASRPPSMLAAGPAGIFFYDGPKRGVRRLLPALSADESVGEDTICSPLFVSSRVVCAHLGGIFDIPGVGAAPRVVADEAAGPIAAVAADEERAYWIVDSGEDQMTVRSASLPLL